MTLFEWLQASGIELPTRAEAMEAGVAAVLTLAMLAGGVVAGRKLGPPVAALIQRFAIAPAEQIGFTVGSRRFSVMLLVTMLVTVVTILALTRAVTRITEQWIGHARGLDPTQKLLAQKLASIGIVVIAFFFAMDLLEIDLTS